MKPARTGSVGEGLANTWVTGPGPFGTRATHWVHSPGDTLTACGDQVTGTPVAVPIPWRASHGQLGRALHVKLGHPPCTNCTTLWFSIGHGPCVSSEREGADA